MSKIKKKPRGGSRTGAGRPHKHGSQSVLVASRMPADVLKQLDKVAKKRGGNRTEVILSAVRFWLDSLI